MENKKREAKEGDEDEMKMEKFYSLLRSFRDARDRRRRELLELEKNDGNRKKMKASATTKDNSEVGFEWQDFTSDIHFRKPPLVFPNPIPCDPIKDNKGKMKREEPSQQKQHKDLALDLRLAL